ncbi:MAG: lactose transporter subunit [Sphingomonas bacterium]|uniref:PTS sugar transporter subunit IIA n=1 Tax=Sphingomonas bacterium TaxID=1895847 RepID=UPI0026223721|nr:PTS sugar transporter subunit IIA [Sphingomonas bacterium]MDB5696186.1 lactose transporter subunit [Sphingomonas bacterium]
MTDLTDLLRSDAVLTGIAVLGKKALLVALAAALARQTGADARVIGEALTSRERLGSTGFGGGVAIPHAKVDGVSQVTAVFARLAHPIDYGAVDAAPVDLVWAMLSPPAAGADHLKALARVSRRLRDRAFLAKLRGAGSPDALYALFAADRARDAA